MDGGWAKWQAEERDITPDCPCPLKVGGTDCSRFVIFSVFW